MTQWTDFDLEEGTRALYYYILGSKSDWSTVGEFDRDRFRCMVRAILRGIEEGWRHAGTDGEQKPIKCTECGVNWADQPSKLCPGCEAYQDHQR